MGYEPMEEFDGIGYVITDYPASISTESGREQIDALDSFFRDDKEIHESMGPYKRFKPISDRPEKLLRTYQSNEVVFSYLCDDYTSFMGGKIIRASLIENGEKSIAFIEHVLNNHSNMLGEMIQGYQPFGNIPFKISESVYGRRTANLLTGANHPNILWREMWNIYVSEIA
ncbi:MAG: hypothetical protein JXC85_03750 [Candidatus Aenigmarchaeota archaeon]|nr:hypothetical protein [Candidatus Aenigmarchaeota archaeon]